MRNQENLKKVFDPKNFSQSNIKSDFDPVDEDRELVKGLRTLYPELADWDDSTLWVMWGCYSREIYEVGWVDWLTDTRDNGFLAYLYIKSKCPEFVPGMYLTDIGEYGDEQPWLLNAPLPQWITRL